MQKILAELTCAGLLALTLTGAPALPAQDTSGPFTDLVTEGDGFFRSPWLGGIYLNAELDGWVWHEKHGWLFLAPEASNEAVFLYDPAIPSWLFTGRSLYPFLYVFALEGWVYYYDDGVTGPGDFSRAFFSFGTDGFLYLSPRVLPDLASVAVSAGVFDTLVAAAGAADLVDALVSGGPFTVFAPTDEAFARIPASTLSALLAPANKALLQSIILHHLVPGIVLSNQLQSGLVETVGGTVLEVSVGTEGVLLDNAAGVVATDVGASNGVVHVIDSVLLGPGLIPGVATAAGQFGTLLAAVEAAGLVETLLGEGPFTVFAPTDEAFAQLPEGTVESLLLPENRDTLVSVLLYHVVAGRVLAADLETGEVETVSGAMLAVSVSTAGVSINDSAEVVAEDVFAVNGVIHVIDTVLLPPAQE